VKNITVSLKDSEIEAVRKALPMLDAFRALIPAGLVSVVHKLEKAFNDTSSDS
jgi:hypothetical protein